MIRGRLARMSFGLLMALAFALGVEGSTRGLKFLYDGDGTSINEAFGPILKALEKQQETQNLALLDSALSSDYGVLDNVYQRVVPNSCFDVTDDEYYLRGSNALPETYGQITNYVIAASCEGADTAVLTACITGLTGKKVCRQSPPNFPALAITRSYDGSGNYSRGYLRCLFANPDEINQAISQGKEPRPEYKLNVCRSST